MFLSVFKSGAIYITKVGLKFKQSETTGPESTRAQLLSAGGGRRVN